MSKIINKIYLGTIKDAIDKEQLKANGITHILVVAHEIPLFYPLDFTYKKINAYDNDEYDISEHFEVFNEFIALGCEVGAILIHCTLGNSRSVSAVMSYLMTTKNYSFDKALSLI